MQTKTLIQTQANILKITSLKKGDVVKIIEDSSYGSPTVYYCIVIDLMNVGSESYIQVLRYKHEYSSLSCELKLYKGTENLHLFPAKVTDLKDYFSNTVLAMRQKIEEKEKSLREEKVAFDKLKDFVSGNLSRKLTEVRYDIITQYDYNESLKHLENKEKEE